MNASKSYRAGSSTRRMMGMVARRRIITVLPSNTRRRPSRRPVSSPALQVLPSRVQSLRGCRLGGGGRLADSINCRCRAFSSSSAGGDRGEGGGGRYRAPAASMVVYDTLSQSMKDLLASAPHFGSEGDDGTGDGTSGMKANATRRRKGVACYICGPTTYDASHLGHARTYVCFDILRRCLERAASFPYCAGSGGSIPPPPPPLFVMNVTDVDDKILNAAAAAGVPPVELARRYEAEFWDDMDALNCLRPHVVTRVTERVESDIVPYIQRIVDSGFAYEVPNDGLYFDVKAFEERTGKVTRYGKLAPPATSTDFYTRLEVGGDGDGEAITQKKRDSRDFVLWKERKAGEHMYWPSPWGTEGRPGWHIECSAMIESVQRAFEDTHVFAVHAGGVDLKFPHHTNEIAQAEAYRYSGGDDDADGLQKGGEWIENWVHTGHLHIDGLKMSKSLKNFVTIKEMLNGDEEDSSVRGSPLSSAADDFRLWCLGLSGHYRATATYSREQLVKAGKLRQKIVRFLLDGEDWLLKSYRHGATTKKWQDADYELSMRVHEASTKCMQALFLSDLDGSTFVNEVVQIAAAGNTYLGDQDPTQTASEPVRTALRTTRELLSLVGFSDVTCRAGIEQARTGDSDSTSQIVGGERALLDELVAFRAAVRNLAVTRLRESKGGDTSMMGIIELCDDRRDRIFPSLGVELVDGKIDGFEDTSSRKGLSLWKYCLPRSVDTKESRASTGTNTTAPQSASNDLRSISLEDFFRRGQYEGQFSEFTDEGMPKKHADGSDLSNRLLKKLRKKRDKHAKRLAQEER